ncbi:MAG: ATP-binding protein [Sandaracinaceae bacterium]|nr:ATP-binding protein [Sandaracinaceae bacterium]
MSAYRAGHGNAPTEEGREDGLVDELIQQFADPLAFYRELVQNSIDAGARSIAVSLSFTPDPGADGPDALGTIDVAVRDDGCGMGREVLEDQLTVLFRSGKEGQQGKIGKFGVGFVSVLAIRPEVVMVRTSEGRGEQWTLALSADQSYDLFRAEGGGGAGTTVTLRLRRPARELDALVEGSVAALVRWCRHAEIPIRFAASAAGGQVLREARIDRPLGLDALVTVRVDDGSTSVVAGLPLDGRPYLAFFNRGLLLYETRKDVLGQVVVSIQDPNLEHTLSRDNVRRDRHYERAMRLANRVVDRHLTQHVEIVAAALARRQREEPALEVLLDAAVAAGLDLDYGAIALPLCEPVGGEATIPLSKIGARGVYVATTRSPLTAAVARRGGRVIDATVGRRPAALAQVLSGLAGRRLHDAHADFTLASPVEPRPLDGPLLGRVRGLLGALARTPEGPRLARFTGARAGALSVAGGDGELPLAIDAAGGALDPFRLLARPTLLLDAEHEVLREARELAEHDAASAAALLARAVLLERGRLDEEAADEAWLEAAAREVP